MWIFYGFFSCLNWIYLVCRLLFGKRNKTFASNRHGCDNIIKSIYLVSENTFYAVNDSVVDSFPALSFRFSAPRGLKTRSIRFIRTGTTNLIYQCLLNIKYVSHDTQHFRCLDVHCLHSEFLSKNAPDWPWQQVTLASFPCSLLFLQPYVMGVIFGMLLMSELEGIPSCWMLSPVSLKTQHQKWDTWKWLTQLSPEFRHFY